MNEKRYVIKSGDYYWIRRQKESYDWVATLNDAHIFGGVSEILEEGDWSHTIGCPRIIEVERVPQPEWREKREL